MGVLTLKTFLAKEETAPPLAWQFLEIAKDSAGAWLWYANQQIQSHNSTTWLLHLGRQYCSALFIPELVKRTRDHLYSAKPTGIIQPSRSYGFTLPWLAFPGYGSAISLFLTTQTLSHVVVRVLAYILFLGPVTVINCVFPGSFLFSSCGYTWLTIT